MPEEWYVGEGHWLAEDYIREHGVGVEEGDEGVGVASVSTVVFDIVFAEVIEVEVGCCEFLDGFSVSLNGGLTEGNVTDSNEQ